MATEEEDCEEVNWVVKTSSSVLRAFIPWNISHVKNDVLTTSLWRVTNCNDIHMAILIRGIDLFVIS